MHGALGRRYFRFLKLVHDDDLGDRIEAVVGNRPAMVAGLHAAAGVGSVAFDYVAFQAFDEFADQFRMKIMVVASFSGGYLDCHLLTLQGSVQSLVGFH